MKRILVPAFFVLAFAAFAPSAAGGGTREEAERIWESAVAAKGGRERLYAVHSILETYPHGGKYPVVMLYAFPGRFWQWAQHPEPLGLSVEMLNAEQRLGYLTYPDDPASPRALGGDFPASARYVNAEAQMYYLLETRWLKPEPFDTFRGEVGGRCAVVVRARVHGRWADFFFDRKTHLPLQVIFPSEPDGKGPYIRFKDYAEVGGVMLPTRVSHQGGGFSRVTITLNPYYDKQVFEQKPTVEAGPDAWRRREGL